MICIIRSLVTRDRKPLASTHTYMPENEEHKDTGVRGTKKDTGVSGKTRM